MSSAGLHVPHVTLVDMWKGGARQSIRRVSLLNRLTMAPGPSGSRAPQLLRVCAFRKQFGDTV